MLVIKKMENSLALSIPSHTAAKLNVRENFWVELSVREGKTLIRLAKPDGKYTLEELIAIVTHANIHKETETGLPVGLQPNPSGYCTSWGSDIKKQESNCPTGCIPTTINKRERLYRSLWPLTTCTSGLAPMDVLIALEYSVCSGKWKRRFCAFRKWHFPREITLPAHWKSKPMR